MAVGTEAKQKIIQKIISALGEEYIGEQSNKYYFWSEEKGQKKQVAISMTCPKNEFAVTPATEIVNEWSMESSDPPKAQKPKDEIPQEELDNLAEMMKRLGL